MKTIDWIGMCGLSIAVGFLVGAAITADIYRNRAVENNAAVYSADPKTGKVQFVWKTNK